MIPLIPVAITVRLTVLIPAEEKDRLDAYGTTDIEACARFDWEHDPEGVLLDSNSELLTVEVPQ